MAEHNELGAIGESLAAEYLTLNGYEILERNYRWERAEVDIIAQQKDWLIFIEVKTRSSADFGAPELFVSKKQMNQMAKVADFYADSFDESISIRFDIISIVHHLKQPPEIEHFESAFQIYV